jgi:hypothetical protein
MEPNELLETIRQQLHLPQEDDAITRSSKSSVANSEAWHGLRKAIRDLEQSAGKVGELPANYPIHLNPVMRVLHALLPWYTRPMQQHAAHTVAVARAIEAVLEDMETRAREASRSGVDSPR